MPPRPTCSVVLATYQRAHLLARSLACYAYQDFPKEEFELVVIDDGSDDGTADMVRAWSEATDIRSVVLTPHPKKTGWRDCGAVINYGIRASSGGHILLTHPEVMPGRESVKRCVDKLQQYDAQRSDFEWNTPSPGMPGLYTCCRVYYLSPREQGALDGADWYGKGPLAVRDIPRFYEDDVNGHPDFSHKATDAVAQPGSRITAWESWVFGGCSRETWRRMGGMLETAEWGSVDVAFMTRRRTLGIPNHTCPEDSTVCVHQNHDDPKANVVTDRNEAKWRAELTPVNLTDPTKLRYPYIDFLGW